MTSNRNQLIEFIKQGAIPAEKIGDTLIALKVPPDSKSWRTFIDNLLLWLGGLALSFAIMFFIAYNWEDIGYFAKFGMVEGFIVLAIIAYCKLAEGTIGGKVSLLVATISLGVLLALYGQTYQTGADSWQLFFNWALLMLPWAVIGRFPAIWIIWVTLINVSIILYYLPFLREFGPAFGYVFSSMLWRIFLFNTLAFTVWQLSATIWHWLSERWAIRLLAIGSGVSLTCLVLLSIFYHQEVSGSPGLVWVLWLFAMYFIYRKVKMDLFMLAGCCLSAITVTVSFLGKYLLRDEDPGAFLLLALIVIGMGGGTALWLKNVHKKSLP